MNLPNREIDEVLEETLLKLNAGVDQTQASETVADCVAAVAKQGRVLANTDYGQLTNRKCQCPECGNEFYLKILNPETLARAMAHTTKCADELARLIHFTQGKPDSRLQFTGMDWLQALTTEQLKQVQEWVAQNRGEDARQ